jgi:outer membrane lipoprotein SlyB
MAEDHYPGITTIEKDSAMRRALVTVAAVAALTGCMTSGGSQGNEWRGYRNYDYNRPDPRYNDYDASRYYRNDRRYREHRMSYNDRIYRGRDGRYYCRRSDGTTGLIAGGVAGGLLGNLVAPGDSETLGAIIGAAAGAAIGREIERGNLRCR